MPETTETPGISRLIDGLVHPSASLVVLCLAVILSGRVGEVALAIVLVRVLAIP